MVCAGELVCSVAAGTPGDPERLPGFGGGFRVVQGFGFRVWGLGFGVWGVRVAFMTMTLIMSVMMTATTKF